MKYHFKVHKEGDGFWAECIELVGCITEADSIEELHENMKEVLNLYVEEPWDSKELIPLPDSTIPAARNIVAVPLDTQIGFACMVRYFRIKNRLTQKQAARKMGFDTIYSYQRLEGKRCNPSLRTISRIKKVYPDFSLDFVMNG